VISSALNLQPSAHVHACACICQLPVALRGAATSGLAPAGMPLLASSAWRTLPALPGLALYGMAVLKPDATPHAVDTAQ
jgi:hypothetical protein